MCSKRPLDDDSHHAFRQHVREPSSEMTAERGYLAYLHDDILGRVCSFLDPGDLARGHHFVAPLMMPVPLCLRERIETAFDPGYIASVIHGQIRGGGTGFVRAIVSYIPTENPTNDDHHRCPWKLDLRRLKYCLSDPRGVPYRERIPTLINRFGSEYVLALAIALCTPGDNAAFMISESLGIGFGIDGGNTVLELLMSFDALTERGVINAILTQTQSGISPDVLMDYILWQNFNIQLSSRVITAACQKWNSDQRRIWLRAIAECNRITLTDMAHLFCVWHLARDMHCSEIVLFLERFDQPLHFTDVYRYDIVGEFAKKFDASNPSHQEVARRFATDSRTSFMVPKSLSRCISDVDSRHETANRRQKSEEMETDKF